MSIIHENPKTALRIIIDGCDGVGKDTFVDYFLAYIYGKGLDGVSPAKTFDAKNLTKIESDALVRKGGRKFGKPGSVIHPSMMSDKERDYAERFPKRYHRGFEVNTPKWENMFAVTKVHPSDGSRESKEYIDNLNKGIITEQADIAKEYLQIHYDLERHCKDLDNFYDIILMNRSLTTYHAMQLHALGFEEHRDNWLKLWRWSNQSGGIYIHLTMPEDKLRERLKARQGEDFRGEVENFYMDNFRKINEGYEQISKMADWKEVHVVDTSVHPSQYADLFESILQRLHIQSNGVGKVLEQGAVDFVDEFASPLDEEEV